MKQPHPHTGRWDGVFEVSRMAGPIVLGAISFTIMQFVDVLFIARLGVEELAAGGSASIWSYTICMFIVGVVACVSTFVAQSLGRGRPHDCARFAWQGLYISAAAVIVTIVMWPLSEPLLSLFPQTPRVVELEIIYFRIRLLGMVFVAAQTALAAYFQAINRPVIPMVIAVIGNLLNIILDYLLIFGNFGFPRWEIGGAAAATVIAMGVQSALLIAIFLSRPMHETYATRSTWQFDLVKAKDLFRIGWPAGIAGLLDVLSWSIFVTFIVGRLGTVQLAAQTAAIQYMHLIFVPAMGINQAITPIVGQWLGKGDIATAKARTYTATKMAMIYMVTVGVFLGIFGYELMAVFSDDEAVRDIGRVLLIFAAVFAGFDAISIVVSGALRGAGDTRWMMMLMLVGSYAVSLPLAWFFSGPVGLGAKGAWLGATIYIILLSGAFFWRFQSEAWRNIQIFSQDLPHHGPAPPNPIPIDTTEPASDTAATR